jgi:hypothetical protein
VPAGHYYYKNLLWEEGQIKLKTNFISRIRKLFSRKKTYKQQDITLSQPSVISVPKVSLRRSAPAVTDMSSYNLAIITGKSNISRSVSLHKQKKTCVANHSKPSHRQPVISPTLPTCSVKKAKPKPVVHSPAPKDQLFLQRHRKAIKPKHRNIENCSVAKNNQEFLRKSERNNVGEEEEDDYDCVYRSEQNILHFVSLPVFSDFVSPAMLIALADKLEEKVSKDETEEEELYEELNAQDHPVLLPISCGRRQPLKIYSFTDQERIQKVDNVEPFNMLNKIDKVEV